MAVVTSDLEFPSSVPASKLFKALDDFPNLAPKVLPDTYKSIVTIQGDGSAGTILEITFADGTISKYKIDAIDHNNFTKSLTVVESGPWMDNLESVSSHIKVAPSANGGSIYKISYVYTCKAHGQFTKEELKLANEMGEKDFKTIEAYVVANPNAY